MAASSPFASPSVTWCEGGRVWPGRDGALHAGPPLRVSEPARRSAPPPPPTLPQVDYQHAIPKADGPAGPRVSLVFKKSLPPPAPAA